MSDTLNVYWGTRLAGQLRSGETASLEFQYDSDWLASEQAIPISVRLPLRAEPFDDKACRIFFANLLPEGNTRALIARMRISAIPATRFGRLPATVSVVTPPV